MAVASSPDLAAHPPPELRFHRRIRLGIALREVWGARQLIRTLAERDLRVRYKQAFLGIAWAVILPVFLMIVFSVFVRRLGAVETGGVAYPLFTFVALVPWTFFSSSFSQGGQSLTSNASLLSKIYCPREVFPIASVMVAAVDAVISTGVLVLLFIGYRFLPAPTSYWIPILLIIQILFTLGITLIVSAVLVYLRDLRHLLPMLLQFALFATPVAYPIELDGTAAWVYAAVNPLGPVIDGYRQAVLFGASPEWSYLAVAGLSSLTILTIGYWVFKRLETNFADVA